VRQFLGSQRRVDGHDRDPGQGRGVLKQDPFGDVVRPHRDPLPRLEPAQQRPRRLLCLGEHLGVGPAAPGSRVWGALDQGDRIGCSGGRVTQQVAHRHLQDWA